MERREAAPGSGPIWCGVAGWSYPDWEGVVYPRRTRDRLRFLAGYVDAIEINTTFYRPPVARYAEAWRRSTDERADFFFCAKLNRKVTHEGRIEDAMVHAYREGLAPLIEAGRLRHVLAQFHRDFSDHPRRRSHLRRIRDDFGGLANLVLELRHESWQRPEALDFLSGLDVTVANLDYPLSEEGFHLRECRVGAHAYLRLHGRNAAAWFDRDAGRDATYNYLYGAQERDELLRRAIALARTSRTLTIVANNHYRGKALVNALQLKARVAGARVPVPPGLLAAYPELAEIAAPDTPAPGFLW